LLDASLNQAIIINRSYIDLLAQVDMSRISNIKRDPNQGGVALLSSIARNIATTVDNTTYAKRY